MIKVINIKTGREHNINEKTLELWQSAGIPFKVVDIKKPEAIEKKEAVKELPVK